MDGLPPINTQNNTSGQSAQLQPGGLPSPVQGGLNWLQQKVIQPIGSIASGIGSEMNQFLGNPLQNMPILGIQSPQQNIEQAKGVAQHAVQHPVNTLMDIATLGGAASIPAGEKTPEAMGAAESKVAPEEEAAAAPKVAPETPKAPTKAEQLESAKRGIQIDGNDVRTVDDVNRINNTMNKYGIKGNMTNQHQMINSTIGTLGDRAENQIIADGGTTARQDLIDKTINGIKYNPKGTTIAPAEMPHQVGSYIQSLYARATGGEQSPVPIEGMVPDNIPDSTLLKMKTIANMDAKSTFSQPDMTKWTNMQQISRYARDTLDNVIDTNHPQVAQLNNEMSDLYNAEPSIRKGANAETLQTQKAAMQPQTSWYSPSNLFKLGGALAGTGLGLKEFGINPAQAAQGALGLGQGLLNQARQLISKPPTPGGQKQIPNQPYRSYQLTDSSIHSSADIPQSMQDVNTSEALPHPADIIGSDGKPLAIDPQTYKQEKSQIDAQVKNYQQWGVPVPQSVLNRQAYLEQSDPSTNPLIKEYQNDSTAYGAANNVLGQLNNVDPNFFNQFTSYNQAMASNDPKYAGFRVSLEALHSYNPTGVDVLFTQASKKGGQVAIQKIMQNIGWKYSQTINTYTGQQGQAVMPSTPSISPSTQPQGLPPMQQQSGGIASDVPDYQYTGGQWQQQ